MADHGFWSYAQRDPRPLALVDPDERHWTRGELLAECNRIVHGLRALGLAHGDTVAVCLPNCAEFYAIYLACLQAGWYLTPINYHLAAPEVAYIVSDCGAKAFIGHERVAGECSRAADEIGFPSHGPLRDRARAGLPPVRRAHRRPVRRDAGGSRRGHGDELHLGHHRQAEGRQARARAEGGRARPDHADDGGDLADVRHQARGRQRPPVRLAALPHRRARLLGQLAAPRATPSC